jgi:hypothetical protein
MEGANGASSMVCLGRVANAMQSLHGRQFRLVIGVPGLAYHSGDDQLQPIDFSRGGDQLLRLGKDGPSPRGSHYNGLVAPGPGRAKKPEEI